MRIVYFLILVLIVRFLKRKRKFAVKQCIFPCPILMSQILSYLSEVVEKFDDGNYYLNVRYYPYGQISVSICKGKREQQGLVRNWIKFSTENGMFCFSLDESYAVLSLNSRWTFFGKIHKKHLIEVDDLVKSISSINYMDLLLKNEQETGACGRVRTPFG